MIFMILLTLWNSEQKNGLLMKLFCFSSDFDETWWNSSTHWVLQLHQVSSKSDEKQKSFIIARFSVQNFKVSVESWNSYIVHTRTVTASGTDHHHHHHFSVDDQNWPRKKARRYTYYNISTTFLNVNFVCTFFPWLVDIEKRWNFRSEYLFC